MNYAPVTIPDLAPDETGYLVNGTQHAAVRVYRSAGAAASMHGLAASAYAVNADGTPQLSALLSAIEGHASASCPKADLLDATGALDVASADAIKASAIDGALTEMLALLAQEAAFSAAGV